MPHDTKIIDVIEALEKICQYYKSLKYRSILYKPTPYIFHNIPSDEDIFAINNLNSSLYRKDISHVIDRINSRGLSKLRIRKIKKANKIGVKVFCFYNGDINVDLLIQFMQILDEILFSKNEKPVHSIDQILSLMHMHPENIFIYLAVMEHKVLAGSLIFRYSNVSHTQYLASSEIGKKVGALDLVISTIIKEEPKNIRYISLGRSPENKKSENLNEGLVFQKEGFGSSSVILNQYLIRL